MTAQIREEIFLGKEGRISLVSNAPLEIIEAESNALHGVINATTRGVAFSVNLQTFHGFNSLLQREHFLENYMEIEKYPLATFTGKLIEKVNFGDPADRKVRVKGLLNIHGVTTERIIQGTLSITGNTIRLSTELTVHPEQHDIQIPKLLSQKIAETITITIEMTMLKQP
jgi:polyisoprenoid-binding protein YceI